jgi:enamine deaminase RidA (YjgF/YER057c/UK114 family)
MRFVAGVKIAVLAYPLVIALVSVWSQEPAPTEPQAGNIQIIRNQRETVVVISGVTPLDKQSGALPAGNLLGQMKQALENLRRTAIRAGVLPAQIVAITVFTSETASAEALRKMPGESYRDWNPVTAVESRKLTTVGALVEIEAVAIARDVKPR